MGKCILMNLSCFFYSWKLFKWRLLVLCWVCSVILTFPFIFLIYVTFVSVAFAWILFDILAVYLVREVNLTKFEEVMVIWAEVSLVTADIIKNGRYVENHCKRHGSRRPRFSGRDAEGLQYQQRGRCTRGAEAENPTIAAAHGSCEKTCRATED